MKQNPAVFKHSKCHKVLPKCLLLGCIAGVVVYCLSFVEISLTEEAFAEHLQSGNALCNCDLDFNLSQQKVELDRQRLFYNRVPKCGSTTVYTLLRKLAPTHGYTHFNSKIYDKRGLSDEEQRSIVEWIKNTPAPCSFDRHVFFINFTRFGETPPVYINMIREPVERLISSFFYKRKAVKGDRSKISVRWYNKKFENCVLTSDPECTYLEGKNYSLLPVPFFCGQEFQCQFLNDPYALSKAKHNIENYYAVVGTLEQMNLTIQVLEALLPQFFGGAHKIYQNLGTPLNRNPRKQRVSEEVKAMLRANLSAEYELYHFVQQRLYRQFKEVVLERNGIADPNDGDENEDDDDENENEESVELQNIPP